jgi:hypothetical protein
MKKCPICGATSFNDMNVCYSCMHNFEEDEKYEIINNCASSGGWLGQSMHCDDAFQCNFKSNQVQEERKATHQSIDATFNDMQCDFSIFPIEKDNNRIVLGISIPWKYLQQECSAD